MVRAHSGRVSRRREYGVDGRRTSRRPVAGMRRRLRTMLPRALAGVCGAAVMGLALIASEARAQPAAFTDVTPPSMLDDMWGEGVAWGDYDNDGDLDLLVSNEGQLLRLFRNNGNGRSEERRVGKEC